MIHFISDNDANIIVTCIERLLYIWLCMYTHCNCWIFQNISSKSRSLYPYCAYIDYSFLRATRELSALHCPSWIGSNVKVWALTILCFGYTVVSMEDVTKKEASWRRNLLIPTTRVLDIPHMQISAGDHLQAVEKESFVHSEIMFLVSTNLFYTDISVF